MSLPMTADLTFFPDRHWTLPTELEAREPPEARGVPRDGVRLLTGHRGTGQIGHHAFTELPGLLRPGDVLVVNTSGTLPAAVDATEGGRPLVIHFSTVSPDGTWIVELRELRTHSRHTTVPYSAGHAGMHVTLRGGGTVELLRPYGGRRLWVARVDTAGAPDVPAYLYRHGRPIRYGYVDRDWPLTAYQTVFAIHPGSAEMPSAARPFTEALVTRLVASGVVIAPITLHTGVASPEAHEKPYPEWYAVPEATARLVNAARGAAGSRVIAVGTTAVRALESAADRRGLVHASSGWTNLVITPERGVRAVDGLLTGFHEPQASHLLMLEAIAGRALLDRCYAEALAAGYLWHEFGDVNLLLP